MKAAAFRCMSGSSRCRLTQRNGGDPPPLLQPHYRAFIALRGSPPLSGASVLSASRWSRLCLSLAIAGQVLTFRTEAWSSFAPSTCRMPLGQYQDILRADPRGSANPRF